MKKAFTFIAAAALILCSAGCQKQELQKDEFGGQTINLTLEATRGDATDTKTTISYNEEYASLESVWTAGDKIYVYSRKSGEKIGELTQTGDIVNQKASATAQYATSYAKFTGRVDLGTGDAITDDYAFVYQGNRTELTPTEGKLTYQIGTSTDVAGLNAWDLAYATGKIQGTAGTDGAASCAVSFTNKLAFGYFTTAGLTETGLTAQYYSGFTFDVKTGTVTGARGPVTLPNQQKFYMPLIPGEVNMDCGKAWSKENGQENGKWGYTTTKQSKSFTATAGSYYRLGRSSNFGPVAFTKTAWTLYETLKDSKFKVSDTKYVYFTQGNLQYIGSATTPYWRVAPDQYSYLGANQGCPTSIDATSTIPEDTDVDLFGWGEVTPPFKGSAVNSDYQPELNGTELAENWATKFNGSATLYADATQPYPKNGDGDYCCLKKEEWTFLFDNQWWGLATVNMNDGTTKKGLVVVPNAGADDSAIKTHAEALLTGAIYKSSASKTSNEVAFSDNFIEQNVIDEQGLLFLPAAGCRLPLHNPTPYLQGSYGDYYTTSTGSNDSVASQLRFGSRGFSIFDDNRYCGYSVRLAVVVVSPTQD